jgi:hypothetical protein
MTNDMSVEQLLVWRLAQADADAPPAPRAARLLDLIRPWWEIWPERFQEHWDRLSTMQLVYGHATTEPQHVRSSHPVPALIAHAEGVETFARVLYLSVRDGTLRLRFHLDANPGQTEPSFDVTFVSEPTGRPVLFARATLSVENAYRLDVELPEELVSSWEGLRVTDWMPFRFILRPRRAAAVSSRL